MQKRVLIGVMLVVITSACENSSQRAIFEGYEALMSFRYKSDIFAQFTLGIGSRPPFYSSGQFLIDRLSPGQLLRFDVDAWHSETRHYTMIHLNIKNVHRTDGGTYTCKFGDLQRTKLFALTVDFRPGKAHCQIHAINESNWELLKCSAEGGSPRGRIACFNYDGTEIPARGEVGENKTHILQDLLINKKSSAYCCAVNKAGPINKHNCYEFVLQRKSNFEMDNYATPAENEVKNYSNIANNSMTTLVACDQTLHNETKTHTLTADVLKKTSIVVLVIAIIILIISLCICVACTRKLLSISEKYEEQRQIDPTATSINHGSDKEDDRFIIKKISDEVDKNIKKIELSECPDVSMKDGLKKERIPPNANSINPASDKEDEVFNIKKGDEVDENKEKIELSEFPDVSMKGGFKKIRRPPSTDLEN